MSKYSLIDIIEGEIDFLSKRCDRIKQQKCFTKDDVIEMEQDVGWLSIQIRVLEKVLYTYENQQEGDKDHE